MSKRSASFSLGQRHFIFRFIFIIVYKIVTLKKKKSLKESLCVFVQFVSVFRPQPLLCVILYRLFFAFMAVFYAPVQWTRLAVLKRAPAVLDQWFTLPIFAWVPVWISFLMGKSTKKYALMLELCSILSYGLAIKFESGFEAALCCHVLFAVYKGVQVQLRLGNHRTFRYLILAVLSCAGFVVLKLLDHWLAQFWVFQRVTGHFWSKVCDVLQFHYSFCFLTTLTTSAIKRDLK
uniref:Transmembrane protein 187 n=1 Tax=Neogobius melanostomus TaxID=47308 RepID=A0A8C6U8E5_9GOBI